MIETRGLSVRLGQRQVLQDIAFHAMPGALTAIVGPNGSGKTTLLRSLSGDLKFTGQASLNGLAIAATPVWDLARHRAVLAQHTPVGFPFTVLEVVRLGLTASARPELSAEEALARVGLAGYEGRLFPELSGGEQQRCIWPACWPSWAIPPAPKARAGCSWMNPSRRLTSGIS